MRFAEPSTLVTAVRDGLMAHADPEAALGMQAYMKSVMPFRGVAKPARERLLHEVVDAHPVADTAALLGAARDLWSRAGFREERYMALSLLGHRRYEGWAEPGWVSGLFRDWIVEGAWWDFTDEIAGRRLGPLLRADPAGLTPVLRAWATDTDRWLRRTSIIVQLQSKEATDVALLTHAIEANLDDPEFFLRKGIGWALRRHSRTDPAWVQAFVEDHPRLSPLSRKEALRHLSGSRPTPPGSPRAGRPPSSTHPR